MMTEIERRRLFTIFPLLLEKMFRQGISCFISGGALGFDTLAAQQVLLLRETHSEVRLILAIPCPSQADRWTEKDRFLYSSIQEDADQVIYVSDHYFPGCMQKRNRFMVDHAYTCVCYLKNCRGGTWNTVSYAYDQHRKIFNLAAHV